MNDKFSGEGPAPNPNRSQWETVERAVKLGKALSLEAIEVKIETLEQLMVLAENPRPVSVHWGIYCFECNRQAVVEVFQGPSIPPRKYDGWNQVLDLLRVLRWEIVGHPTGPSFRAVCPTCFITEKS